MNRYIQNLRSYLEQQSPCFDYDDANSLLEMLYYCYTSVNPVENNKIRSQFEKMDTVLSQLSLEDNDAVFLLTVNLCGDYQKQAFLAGVHVGMRLFTELQTEDCSLF